MDLGKTRGGINRRLQRASKSKKILELN